MHEQSLMRDLLNKINQLASAEDKPLVAINIELGELAHISASHLREHFEREVANTPLQTVNVNITHILGINHPRAQEIVLKSLEFEDDHGS